MPYDIFSITNSLEFDEIAIRTFRRQAKFNPVYRKYIETLRIDPAKISVPEQIPFLPISFFRSENVITGNAKAEKIFLSSGTTEQTRSAHHVTDLSLYRESMVKGFEHFFGLKDKSVLSLVPTLDSSPDSSLAYMCNVLMLLASDSYSQNYLAREKELSACLAKLRDSRRGFFLIGISYALLDFAQKHPMMPEDAVIIETGGMKGRKREMVREELHAKIKEGFGVKKVYSEYGMTELLSQAYSIENGLFLTPPWMKVLIRDLYDPLSIAREEQTGAINVIDLANLNSCSFIATEDLGRSHPDNSFEVLGRMDNAEVRGCALLMG